jgi:hypothetical protein
MTVATKMVWYDSATTAISQTASVSDTYVVGGDAELDNSTLCYPLAQAVFDVPDTLSAAPVSGKTIDLYMLRGEVDGTSDATKASYGVLTNSSAVTDVAGMEYLGSFVLYPVDEQQRHPIVISILGVKKAKFYIKNNSGVSLTYSSNPITVKILPFTLGI